MYIPMTLSVVSILILLEVILEALVPKKFQSTTESFNPYFTGSNSGSVKQV